MAAFLPEEDAPRLWLAREQLLAGAVHVAHWRLRRADGHHVDVEISAKILPDGRWITLARDVGEQRAAQDALERAHASERRLRTRLEAATEATLVVSTALAEMSERGRQGRA
jgi:hypothetical protein